MIVDLWRKGIFVSHSVVEEISFEKAENRFLREKSKLSEIY